MVCISILFDKRQPDPMVIFVPSEAFITVGCLEEALIIVLSPNIIELLFPSIKTLNPVIRVLLPKTIILLYPLIFITDDLNFEELDFSIILPPPSAIYFIINIIVDCV